jgi:three-Cys-motif partner protein
MGPPGMVYPVLLQFMPKPDFSKYPEDKSAAYIKHCLLQEYLPRWAYKVGHGWDSLVYVDGFAGPWETTDPNLTDTSFDVAIDALRDCKAGLSNRGRSLTMSAILVERDPDTFSKLEAYALRKSPGAFHIHPLKGRFVDNITRIEQIVKREPRPFKFVLLDPKGWADIPIDRLKTFLNSRSCEVLVNLMTKHIVRFLEAKDRESSYQNLFGRDGVLETLKGAKPGEKMDAAVKEYCRSLKLLCGFSYVSSAIVLEPDRRGIRYFLVYATNAVDGIDVFKSAEIKAARIQESVRDEHRIRKSGQPDLQFGGDLPFSSFTERLRQRYTKLARAKLAGMLLRNCPMVLYRDLYCEAMAFPLVTPEDLLQWLDELDPLVKLNLVSDDGKNRRKASIYSEDFVIVKDLVGLSRRAEEWRESLQQLEP